MITTTDIKLQYTPLTPTDTFPFDITYFENDDISVILTHDGVADVYLLEGASTNGFTITPVNGDPEYGGTVDTTEEYTDGDTITIIRTVPVTQLVELVRGGDIPPEIINTAFDRGVAISQQISQDITNAISIPLSDPAGLNYTVEPISLRAGKAVGWDSLGNVVGIDLVSTGSIAVDTTRGLSMINNVINVKVDDDTIDFSSAGELQVKNTSIDTGNIIDGAITTVKIDDDAVTLDKIDDDVLDTPYQEYTSIKSGSGNVELVVADGSLIKITMTGDTTLSFNLTDYADDGVNRVSIDLYTGGFNLTLSSTSIDSGTSFILDGSTVNPLMFRSSGSGKFFGRQ